MCVAAKNGGGRALIVPCSVPVCAALPHCLLLQPRASHRLTPPYTALHRLTPHAASSPTVVVLRRAFAPLRARTTRRPCRPRRAVPPTLPNTVSSPVYRPVYSPVPARPLLHVRLKLPQQLFQKRREATRRDPTRPYFAPRIALPPALRVPRLAPPPLRCLLFKGQHDRLGKRRGKARAPKRPPHPLERLGQTHPLVGGVTQSLAPPIRVERRVQLLGERRRRPSRRAHLFNQRAQCLKRATEGTGGTDGTGGTEGTEGTGVNWRGGGGGGEKGNQDKRSE